MKTASFWKISTFAASLIATFALATFWHVSKAKRSARQLDEETKTLRIRADQGDPQAQYELGLFYHHGKGVPEDDGEAVRWYRKSADQGDARAQYALGSMYYYGDGVPQDYFECLSWYRKAANQGSANAENGLALMYSQGQGVSQDYAEAVRWYRKAVDQGYVRSQYNLGNMYYYGRGVPQDRAEAIRLYRKAADRGDPYARRALSVPISTWAGIALLVQFLGAMWFFFDSRRGNSWNVTSSRRRLMFRFTAALCAISATFSWYGYSHYLFRCLNCGFSALTLSKWLLDAACLGALIYLLLPSRSQQHETGATDDSGIEPV